MPHIGFIDNNRPAGGIVPGRKEIDMASLLRGRELHPVDGRKSFYGKAWVKEYADGTQVLRSYETDVMRRNPDGTLVRLWWNWSATTGRHIFAFCGLRKADLDKMEYVEG